MAGFVPLDADAWPVIAELLPKPWPREAALFDLRWQADRACDRRKLRSEPTLGWKANAARWGWGQNPTRALMRAESHQ